jgi:hypothetical protein
MVGMGFAVCKMPAYNCIPVGENATWNALNWTSLKSLNDDPGQLSHFFDDPVHHDCRV